MATKGAVTIKPFDDLVEKHYREHPEEIDEFVTIIFEDYFKDNDLQALLSSLRIVSRAVGNITQIAEQTGKSRRGLQKALSSNGNPEFGTVLAILQSLGYKLMPQKI